MRIGLICPEVPGHLNPLTTLGGELAERGHQVTLIGVPMAEPFAIRSGLSFARLGEDCDLTRRHEQEFRALAACSSFGSMVQTGKIFGLGAKIHLKHLPAALDGPAFDGLVIDQLSPAATHLADQKAIPFVVACNALAMHWDPLMPPPPLPWGFRDDWIGRVRNRFAKAVLPPIYYLLSDQRGTQIDPLQHVFEHHHGLAHIAQQPAFFEFPRTAIPETLHYTGPWHRAGRDDGTTDFPWDWLDGRPLIYASMGTLQNNLTHVFDGILESVRDLPLQVVLTKGGGDVQIPGPLPDNVLCVDRAPQLRLLERATAAITHAGLNTALECLGHGVPMLCLPVTNDQPGVAKRVEWLGAGRVLPVGRVTPKRLRRELEILLRDDSYRAAAQSRQRQLAPVDGPSLAADVVESAFQSGRPVPAGERFESQPLAEAS